MKKTAIALALSLIAAGAAVAAEVRYCSTDGTMLFSTGEYSQRDDGTYEKFKCGGTPQHTRYYKLKP